MAPRLAVSALDKSTQPLALNFLVCVDDFKVETGCTWVLPASHHVAEFPSEAYIQKFEQPIELERGSVIVLDAMTYHRAGINCVPGHARRALNHVVGLPFLVQQIDIPRLLLHLRSEIAPRKGSLAERLAFKMWARVMTKPTLYRLSSVAGRIVQRVIPISRAWTKGRDLRPIESKSFHELWTNE